MKEIKLSEVQQLIDSGKTRKEISEMFELTASQAREVFDHPLIKGRRPKKNPIKIIVDVETPNLHRGTSFLSNLEVDILPEEGHMFEEYEIRENEEN